MTCMVESASACGGIDAVPRRRSTDEARESGVEDRSGTCADGREAGAFGRSGPEAAIDGATLRVPAADHAAGGPRGGRPGLHALGVHRGLEDVAERVPARRPPAAPRKSESLFAVVEVPAADHAAGGPRGGRPGLHALGVHRGLEDVAERVQARRPPAAPRKSESLFAVVEVPFGE